MPILTLKVSPAQPPERVAQLTEALTRITHEQLHKRHEVTAIVVEPVPASHWHIGAAAVRKPTAFLEISITQGTNTAQERGAFVVEAHAELQRQLAPGGTLELASYVIVREVPASDWGYGGRTQESRRISP